MAVTEQAVAMAPAASTGCSSLVQHIPTPVRSSTFVFGTLAPRVGIRVPHGGRIISRVTWEKGVRGTLF